jgi:SAM-dependent methyltransferase
VYTLEHRSLSSADDDADGSRGTIREIVTSSEGMIESQDIYEGCGAFVYDALTGEDPGELAELLNAVRGRRGRLLELGCGSGRLTLPLLTLGFKVTALDHSPSMLAVLRERAEHMPARIHGGLTVHQKEMSEFNLHPETFDVVLLGATTVSLLDNDERLATFERVCDHLTPDGLFVFSSLDVDESFDGESIKVGIYDIAERGPSVITMIEDIEQGRDYRDILVLVQSLRGDLSPAIFRTRPRVVTRSSLVTDLSRASLTIVHEASALVGSDRRGDRILVCKRMENSSNE